MANESTFNVLIVTLDRVIFEGKGQCLILPGAQGTFEVMPYHKKLLSRLTKGSLILDGSFFPILGGVVKVSPSEVMAIVEEAR
jgi:F0F1-type ATP synthase epsilon subunit